MVSYWVVSILGYFIGGFPTGVILSKRRYGLDVREMGSGNIGATNVTRVFGWFAGVLTFVIDVLKGILPIMAVRSFYPTQPELLAWMGAALVIGHCYSIYLGFRGGKGVATTFGCLLVVAPRCAAVSALVYALCLILTRISAIGSLAGMLASWLYVLVNQPPQHIKHLIFATTAVVLYRHKSNIRRLYRTFQKRQKK